MPEALASPRPLSLKRRSLIAAARRPERFYRPELDALRFFAFAGVLMTHGPDSPGIPFLVTHTGSLGLPMFFMLSACQRQCNNPQIAN